MAQCASLKAFLGICKRKRISVLCSWTPALLATPCLRTSSVDQHAYVFGCTSSAEGTTQNVGTSFLAIRQQVELFGGACLSFFYRLHPVIGDTISAVVPLILVGRTGADVCLRLFSRNRARFWFRRTALLICGLKRHRWAQIHRTAKLRTLRGAVSRSACRAVEHVEDKGGRDRLGVNEQDLFWQFVKRQNSRQRRKQRPQHRQRAYCCNATTELASVSRPPLRWFTGGTYEGVCVERRWVRPWYHVGGFV